jgi:flagellar protein FliS
MISNPYQQYRKTQAETARPQDLVLMLYDGAVKNLNLSKSHMSEGNIEKAHEHLVKAQDIVLELSSSINSDAGEIALQLGLLYDYLYRRLMEANTKKDMVIVDEVVGFLKDLRQTWASAIQLAKTAAASNA